MNKKINKVKSIIAVALLLLLCMCFLCGCTPEEKEAINVKYEIRYSGSYCKANYSNYYRGESYLDALDEIRLYCEDVNITAFEESIEEDSERELNQILRSYDEDFFDKKILVFAIYTGCPYQIKGITLKSIKLVEHCIRIELDIDYNAGFIATPMVMPSEQWVILAEINRSDLKYRYIESEYTIYNFNIL